MNTRESVLELALESLEETFPELECRPFPVRVSVGFPLGQRKAKSPVQVFPSSASTDSRIEIFINPAIRDLAGAVAALARGLALAVSDCDKRSAGYRAAKAALEAVDMTAAVAEIVADLPEYPGAMDISGRKKQTTRMHKIECPTCGFIARMSDKWITQIDESTECLTGCGETLGNFEGVTK